MGSQRTKQGDDAVPRPNLRIPGRVCRGTKAMGGDAVVQDFQRMLFCFCNQVSFSLFHVFSVWGKIIL